MGVSQKAPLDRGREGSAPPLPPNRTCDFPAYGSPVTSFHIGIEQSNVNMANTP